MLGQEAYLYMCLVLRCRTLGLCYITPLCSGGLGGRTLPSRNSALLESACCGQFANSFAARHMSIESFFSACPGRRDYVAAVWGMCNSIMRSADVGASKSDAHGLTLGRQ